jgi:hypothetical protein
VNEVDVEPVQQLLAVEAIKQLKSRYFRYVDTQQWAALQALFTEDAHYDVDGGSGHHEWDGPGPFIAHLSKRMEGAVSVHQGHMPDIELLDADHARGTWAMFDYVDVPGKPPYQGYGHYEETYRREPGGWRIASLKLTRLRVDLLPGRPERLY